MELILILGRPLRTSARNPVAWRKKRLRIAGKIVLVTLVGLSAAHLQARRIADATESRLVCREPDVSKSRLEIECTLENRTDGYIHVSTGNAALEGPSPKVDFYMHPYVAGERYENVVQYDLGDLDRLPIMFKPVVHPTLSDIAKLRKLPAKEKLSVSISWDISSDGMYLAKDQWNLRIKLIYISDRSLLKLLNGDEILDGCKRSIRIARSSVARTPELRLDAFRPPPGMRNSYDGCRNIIAVEFVHVFSNTVPLSILEQGLH